MFGLQRKRVSEAVSLVDRLNHLVIRVDKLEMESAERQLTVLKTVEKVLYQLRARTAKREKPSQDDAGETIPQAEPSDIPQREFVPTAHLARRFRSV